MSENSNEGWDSIILYRAVMIVLNFSVVMSDFFLPKLVDKTWRDKNNFLRKKLAQFERKQTIDSAPDNYIYL